MPVHRYFIVFLAAAALAGGCLKPAFGKGFDPEMMAEMERRSHMDQLKVRLNLLNLEENSSADEIEKLETEIAQLEGRDPPKFTESTRILSAAKRKLARTELSYQTSLDQYCKAAAAGGKESNAERFDPNVDKLVKALLLQRDVAYQKRRVEALQSLVNANQEVPKADGPVRTMSDQALEKFAAAGEMIEVAFYGPMDANVNELIGRLFRGNQSQLRVTQVKFGTVTEVRLWIMSSPETIAELLKVSSELSAKGFSADADACRIWTDKGDAALRAEALKLMPKVMDDFGQVIKSNRPNAKVAAGAGDHAGFVAGFDLGEKRSGKLTVAATAISAAAWSPELFEERIVLPKVGVTISVQFSPAVSAEERADILKNVREAASPLLKREEQK